MKIANITRHAMTNYGSLLQAIATQNVIRFLGHECETIDYIRYDEHYKTHEKTLLAFKKDWNSNPFKRFLYLCLRQPEAYYSGRKFEKEREKLLNLSKRYSSCDELKKNKPNADIYMTGSDQVWGPVENGEYDSAYCLSFTDDTDKKIAYAASFGRTEINDNIMEYYKQYLSCYDHITVREASAVEMIKSLGLSATHVIDPTLLLDKNSWKQYFKPIKYKKYVLIYQIHNGNELGEYALKVSQKMGLPLIRVSTSLHHINRPGKLVVCPTIGEFLSFIDNAECLITDSFHGTAFAINFNTQFVEVLPNNKTGTRNMSILELTGLSDRILSDPDDVDLALRKIDFNHCNSVIASQREFGLKIFGEMIVN